ncbi:hypothetical protein ACE2AK_17475 [Rahnella perminowiae]|jgi:hypothetical protein|uniref:Uncharacterized protein n=1 Tax=Rahnella perminowiae TaxID=2816244 RepID=A0ABS6L5A0_9GAMM|nr:MULTISPECIES: hypothetical protein [Rahnella]MBU9809265.1 hypothetical protein [Rahnella perminowiae]MBU9823859.1 hypothetical protein [Rahnella perminowiae]MBU9837016.1 hypothetical protein [Rahnella perminowiae]MCX2946226.1 hypothetical protein [Rahnella perminowiae]
MHLFLVESKTGVSAAIVTQTGGWRSPKSRIRAFGVVEFYGEKREDV